MVGYIPTWFTYQQTVTHPSSKRARSMATSLIKTNVLDDTAKAPLMPNTHRRRRRRRDETVESRRVGGVYTNSQLVGDSFVASSVGVNTPVGSRDPVYNFLC